MIPKHPIFVNLKRFDIPRSLGGVCSEQNPVVWIEQICEKLASSALPTQCSYTLLLPESLIVTALETVAKFPNAPIVIGCQSVIAGDVAIGGNFGAFTGMRTAKSMQVLGCTWSMIGHSEERKTLKALITSYDPDSCSKVSQITSFINNILKGEVKAALNGGLKVLLCIGETIEERGDGTFETVKAVLENQLEGVLSGLDMQQLTESLVVAYEPVWSIGPGRPIPTSTYLEMIASIINGYLSEKQLDMLPLVYGGGLRSENVDLISRVPGIQGGLVALTRFSGEIGFYPDEFVSIVTASHWASHTREDAC